MLKKLKKTRIISVLCLGLLLALILSGCSALQDSEEGKQLCTEFMDHVLDNDQSAAYAMVDEICTAQDFAVLWSEMRTTLKDSETYELEQTGWYTNLENGVTTTTVTFEMVTDDGKTCQLELITQSGSSDIAGFYFLDSTAFVESTAFLPFLNIILAILSLGALAFTVWMLIDCAKRNVRSKALWILLILVGGGFTLTIGPDTFDLSLSIAILLNLTTVTAIPTALALSIRVVLPVGTLVYFFVRKQLKPPQPPQAMPQQPPMGYPNQMAGSAWQPQDPSTQYPQAPTNPPAPDQNTESQER